MDERKLCLVLVQSLIQLLETHTGRQGQALITAYNVPRKVSSEEVSIHIWTKSTFVEHLRKAERKIVVQVIGK